MSFAILIDAGFLKQKLGSASSPIDANTVEKFVESVQALDQLKNHVLHRIYFYDSPPFKLTRTKPLQGGQIRFDKDNLVHINEKLHSDLKRKDNFALRMGETHFRGWNVDHQFWNGKNNDPNAIITSNNLRPNIEQKGVDMRIGLDIASLALKKLANIVVLVTGDSDFVPAMKYARREGLKVCLITLEHNVYDIMYEHADIVIQHNPLNNTQLKPKNKLKHFIHKFTQR